MIRRLSKTAISSCILVAILGIAQRTEAQASLQVGADAAVRGHDWLRIDHVAYRAARWEEERVNEPERENPNRGGWIVVYFTNVSNKPLDLAFWRINDHDESWWYLGGGVAWHRTSREHLEPGESGLTEISAVDDNFRTGRRFCFVWVDRKSWQPVGRVQTTLTESPVQISCIRILPGMREVEAHFRHTGKGDAEIVSLDLLGHSLANASQWVGKHFSGAGNAIARLSLDKPLSPSEMVTVRVRVQRNDGEFDVYSHRRAFEDVFPIGVWTNGPETWALLRRMHVDTVVQGGRAEDEFFTTAVKRFGFRTIASFGMPADVDSLRSLATQPSVITWMLADEPDWSIPPSVVEFHDRTVRRYDNTRPTFLTLCRNRKFFEYAQIADIPCMDHYSVTAPSSSKWPTPYGTHLEETGYYTRDLKAASEPKPIWIWSQAIADWSERPQQQAPTPNELAAQLMLNLANGAKGIIWFNYDQKMGDKYPDTREAMKQWGRVLYTTRDDFLASEPLTAAVKAPPKVDAVALATWDKLLLCVTNLDYEIDPKAYPFKVKNDLKISTPLPEWMAPKVALIVSPEGIRKTEMTSKKRHAEVSLPRLEACQLVVLCNDASAESLYASRFQQAIEEEDRQF